MGLQGFRSPGLSLQGVVAGPATAPCSIGTFAQDLKTWKCNCRSAAGLLGPSRLARAPVFSRPGQPALSDSRASTQAETPVFACQSARTVDDEVLSVSANNAFAPSGQPRGMSVVAVQAGRRMDRPTFVAGSHGPSTVVAKGRDPVAGADCRVSGESPPDYDIGLPGHVAAVPGAVVPVIWPARLRLGRSLHFVDVVESGGKQSKHREAGESLAKVFRVGPARAGASRRLRRRPQQ